MSSALSITRAVNPPRAVYLDYPLGRTAGKPGDKTNQREILRDTLAAFADIETPGTIVPLAYEWSADDSWKDRVMRPDPDKSGGDSQGEHNDDRVARLPTPQYQTPADEAVADTACPSCVFLEDNR